MIYLEEHIVPGKRLGRHVDHDPRSLAYPAELAPSVTDVLHASYGLPLDQGNVGACTAFATAGNVNTQPNFTGPLALPHSTRGYPATNTDGMNLYVRETADEGQPYPQYDPGGTGLAVCKAARELGWIARYAHAFTFDSALRSLVMRPVITGVNWYDSFDSPDSQGVITISPDASVRGGHEFAVVGIDTANQLVLCWNSWGLEYGLGGRFRMPYGVWERLLSEQGDVTVPGAAVAR